MYITSNSVLISPFISADRSSATSICYS